MRVIQTIHHLRREQAATLPELMVTICIFGMVVMGLISANMFGLKQDELVTSKLGANDQSRMAFDLLVSEIRSCKNVYIGSGSATSFNIVPDGQLQQGNAIQIFPTTDTNFYVRYFFQTNNNVPQLCRITSGATDYHLVVQYLTNSMIFQATDYTNNVLRQSPEDYNHNYVVSVLMEFYQYQYPMTKVGSNYLFDYYRLQFKATRRSP